MIKLKCEPNIHKLVPFNASIPEIDKDILERLCNGKQAEALRMILFTFRDELRAIADANFPKKKKSKKAS